MPKPARGGQRAATSTYVNASIPNNNATASQPAPQPQPATQPAPQQPSNGPYSNMTAAEADAFYRSANYDGNIKDAINIYKSAQAAPYDVKKGYTDTGYSRAQWLNHKLKNGLKLNSDEFVMNKFLKKGMQPIGKNTYLYRATHDGMLKKLGISDYTKLTEQQLQSRLTGASWRNDGYVSASYDMSKNPFTSASSAVSGGREIYLNIKTPSTTRVVVGARKQAEMVIDKGSVYTVTGCHYDNSYASPRNGGTKRRLIIDVEVSQS